MGVRRRRYALYTCLATLLADSSYSSTDPTPTSVAVVLSNSSAAALPSSSVVALASSRAVVLPTSSAAVLIRRTGFHSVVAFIGKSERVVTSGYDRGIIVRTGCG